LKELDPAVRDRLDRFAALLLRWNGTLNLIAPRDAALVWQRHIEDSLQLIPLIPPGVTRAIDLGSGGGFPGLVLAIATGVTFELIESDRRKASFLRTAITETGATAAVHDCRIEAADIPQGDLVTARALAPLPRLLPLAERLLSRNGVALFLKGARADQELADARLDWDMIVTRTASVTSPDGTILHISALRRRVPP
jgi:16S rRNA (guanine527-N7)-methyltransferase